MVLDNLPTSIRCLLGDITVPEDGGHYLAQELEDGHLIGVSNGSIKKGQGSHAWVLAGHDEDILFMTGTGPVDGDPSIMSSYWAETQGQVALCICTSLLAQSFRVNGKITTA